MANISNMNIAEIHSYIDFLISNEELIEKLIVKLQALLNEIPLENFKLAENLRILCNLIDKCREVNASKNIIDCIIQRWDPNTIGTVDADGLLGDLSATYLCSMKNLKYLISMYDTSTSMSILDSHIRSRTDSGMVFNIVANRILEAYGIENLEEYEWEQLVSAAEQTQTLKSKQHTLLILHYINEKLKSKNRIIFADKPEWVNLPPESEEEVSLGSIEKIQENDLIVKEFMSNIKADTVLPEEAVSLALSVSLNSENTKADRLYGPVNAIVGFNCIGKPGPCRMLYCLCKEEDEDDEDCSYETVEEPWKIWFKGECEICHKSIRKFRYAIRFPLHGGGFEGCFCSFDCALKNPRPLNDFDIHRLEEIERLLYAGGICDKD
jgi:hypothetical protein